MSSIRPNPTHVGWIGFGWTYVMGWVGLGWVEFFLTHHDGLGQKISSTRPMHTPNFLTSIVLDWECVIPILTSIICLKDH